MKPTCKRCETKHWTYEDHTITSSLDKVQKLGASVLRNNVTEKNNVTQPLRNNVTPVTKPAAHVKKAVPTVGGAQPLVHSGQPRKHKTNAERQRAYRGRSK